MREQERVFSSETIGSSLEIAKLAAALNKAGYRHWSEILNASHSQIKIYDFKHNRKVFLTKDNLERILQFKAALGRHKRTHASSPNHRIRILESADMNRFFEIDTFHLPLLDSELSLIFENLFLGVGARMNTAQGTNSRVVMEEDLQEDVDFFNFYFGLGIKINRTSDSSLDIDIPENVEIVPPVVIAPQGEIFRGRRPTGTA